MPKGKCKWQVIQRGVYYPECNLGVNCLKRCYGYENCDDYEDEELARTED